VRGGLKKSSRSFKKRQVLRAQAHTLSSDSDPEEAPTGGRSTGTSASAMDSARIALEMLQNTSTPQSATNPEKNVEPFSGKPYRLA
jgi:hypothetical protein